MENIEAENRGLDKDLFDILLSAFERQNCHQTLGFKFTYLGKGTAGIKMVPSPQFSTGAGRVHGGVLAALADTVMGTAAATLGHVYRTAELKINYLAPVYEETEIIAEGHVIHPGKTLAVVEGDLFNRDGKLIAKSIGTFFRDKKIAGGEETLKKVRNLTKDVGLG